MMRPTYSLHKKPTTNLPLIPPITVGPSPNLPYYFIPSVKHMPPTFPLIPPITVGPSPNLPYSFNRKHDMKYSQNN